MLKYLDSILLIAGLALSLIGGVGGLSGGH